MASEVTKAERALHRRTALACASAQESGVPGRFRVWECDGVLAVLATDPALGFLATVSGVTSETAATAICLAGEPVWAGVKPTLVVSAELAEPPAAGLVRTRDRLLAVKRLDPRSVPTPPEVVDAEVFLSVLLAGFEAPGVLTAFLAAEHRLPAMHRFLEEERGTPIAAAGMTIHDDVAVLGGAATLRAHRGRGAQPRLLRRRLEVAAAEGCTLAVATARPESASAANLERAGFRLHRRTAWTTP
ncbi:MAG TPA: GNAT family N-acetyltransferase [Amycolatopsis sp.]|nr:GNAT family N-acetyltransferase [Amycolatopsis sp.]